MARNLTTLVESLRIALENELLIFKGLLESPLSPRGAELKVLVASICTTGGAISQLEKHPEYFFTESTMLARAFIEKTVNLCYLMLCDDSQFKKYFSHVYYRAYHNWEREKYAGEKKVGLRYLGKSILRNHLKVSAALQEFSETDHRHKWSKLNIDEKVTFIGAHSDVAIEFFLMNTLTIYSDASEALHGSLYGCTFHIGASDPGLAQHNPEAVTESVYKKTALLIAQVSSMLDETIKLMSGKDSQQSKKSNEVLKVTLGIMKEIFGPN